MEILWITLCLFEEVVDEILLSTTSNLDGGGDDVPSVRTVDGAFLDFKQAHLHRSLGGDVVVFTAGSEVAFLA